MRWDFYWRGIGMFELVIGFAVIWIIVLVLVVHKTEGIKSSSEKSKREKYRTATLEEKVEMLAKECGLVEEK